MKILPPRGCGWGQQRHDAKRGGYEKTTKLVEPHWKREGLTTQHVWK